MLREVGDAVRAATATRSGQAPTSQASEVKAKLRETPGLDAQQAMLAPPSGAAASASSSKEQAGIKWPLVPLGLGEIHKKPDLGTGLGRRFGGRLGGPAPEAAPDQGEDSAFMKSLQG